MPGFAEVSWTETTPCAPPCGVQKVPRLLGFATASWIADALKDHPLRTPLWCPESATPAGLCDNVVECYS
eukprot:5507595-Pyramimonas_sp.AAC.1